MSDTKTPLFNGRVMMSGVDYFSDSQAINAYMDSDVEINLAKAAAEHEHIRSALRAANVEVIKVDPPAGCQDGVYTANWALIRGNKAVLSRLPNARKDEEAYARKQLESLGFETFAVPDSWRFSGQGDALPCGSYLLAGSRYRTDEQAHGFLAETLGFEVISLQTKPKRNLLGLPVTNKASGWPDSYYYDIDLALAVIQPHSEDKKGLIAWAPHAFTRKSRAKIRALPMDKIEVSVREAKHAFACNLISTGHTVIMSAFAPKLKTQLESRGLQVVTPVIKELGKGGGYIRCTTLTLDN